VSGHGCSNSTESTLRRQLLISNGNKIVFQEQHQMQKPKQNEKEDDECTCNLRSIIIHQVDVINAQK
jgi:hypothetical protein